jgi:hypothetical protein
VDKPLNAQEVCLTENRNAFKSEYLERGTYRNHCYGSKPCEKGNIRIFNRVIIKRPRNRQEAMNWEKIYFCVRRIAEVAPICRSKVSWWDDHFYFKGLIPEMQDATNFPQLKSDSHPRKGNIVHHNKWADPISL